MRAYKGVNNQIILLHSSECLPVKAMSKDIINKPFQTDNMTYASRVRTVANPVEGNRANDPQFMGARANYEVDIQVNHLKYLLPISSNDKDI